MQERLCGYESDAHIARYVDLFSGLPPQPNVENLYDRSTVEGSVRAANLELYLNLMLKAQPRVLLIGEAPGYQGTRRTGVPFASECMIDGLQADAPFFAGKPGFRRAYPDTRPYREPTSTIMWRTISQLERLPLLWASFPHHPHRPDTVESNRAPSSQELLASRPLLDEFLHLFPVEQVVAVGNVAEDTLRLLGVEAVKVRHPSRGGASLFAEQLFALLAR